MNEIEAAHAVASEALVALFKDHHANEPPAAIAHRVDDVLEALATFSASVALQEIQAHTDANPSPTSTPAIADNPQPPRADL